MAKQPSGATPTSFEDNLKSLEQIVRQMETETLDLESSIKAFEEGMALSKQCEVALKEAQQKVEIIMQHASPTQSDSE